ncbi:hypothetical protein [Hymenobacter cellulosilyticus]|uniref:Uncharacterized protein n=1 Tax=Hymenobacter cellulosilyticus TaxID=2932248 RepID=A0A8T9QAV0_9BACT|nr:hypothetical protein [Hymenobacter cellulosilyticus]UOQ74674.1 hypothetical protein MUN79_12850 [Hymenobacter cellulosilyticus]
MEANRKKLHTWNRWTTHLLALVMGLAGGALAMQYNWLAGPYETVPKEIIREPPPPGATWCVPEASLHIATQFQKELVQELKRVGQDQLDSVVLARTVKKINSQYNSNIRHLTVITLHKGRYEVLASDGFDNATLVTNEGTYKLHSIPIKFHEKYDSLVAARFARRH